MTNSRTLLPNIIDRNSVTEVDGIEVHVAGDGPRTMVFVHGWPDTWRARLRLLRAHPVDDVAVLAAGVWTATE